MSTITISRQMGSFGGEIASSVAKSLGFRLFYRELINQAALRSGAPEIALAAIDELGLLGICPSPQACLAYRQAVEEIMFELANEGKYVILGRAGQTILKNRPDVFHVRLTAPIQLRVQRVAARQEISYECALAQVQASDRFRTNYLNRFYHAKWDDPRLYHLTINTGFFTPGQATTMICLAASQLFSEEGTESSQQEFRLEYPKKKT